MSDGYEMTPQELLDARKAANPPKAFKRLPQEELDRLAANAPKEKFDISTTDPDIAKALIDNNNIDIPWDMLTEEEKKERISEREREHEIAIKYGLATE